MKVCYFFPENASSLAVMDKMFFNIILPYSEIFSVDIVYQFY